MSEPSSAPSSSRRILIIDDDDGLRKYLGRALRRHGMAVEDFASGERAVARLREQRFDCAIVDLVMPGWDGVRTCRALRAVHADLPLIVWSGGAPRDLEEAARALGLVAYFDKPCDTKHLVEALATIGPKGAVQAG